MDRVALSVKKSSVSTQKSCAASVIWLLQMYSNPVQSYVFHIFETMWSAQDTAAAPFALKSLSLLFTCSSGNQSVNMQCFGDAEGTQLLPHAKRQRHHTANTVETCSSLYCYCCFSRSHAFGWGGVITHFNARGSTQTPCSFLSCRALDKHTHEEWNIHWHSRKTHKVIYSLTMFKTVSNTSLMENPSSGLFLYFTQSRQSKKYTQLLTVYLTPQIALGWTTLKWVKYMAQH